MTLNNLAVLSRKRGNLAEANELNQRAIALFTKALGAEHPTTRTSLRNAAKLAQADLEQ